MSSPQAARRPLRWASRLGWLLVVGCLGLAIVAATGANSEQQLIDASLYVVLPLGFGIGMIIASRRFRDVPTAAQAAAGVLLLGAIFAAIAAFARWYFFLKVFDRL
jgi:1,4-dihydroxy-2-naphthoate octaprenyltransferase